MPPYNIVVAAGTFEDVTLESECAGAKASVRLVDLRTPEKVSRRTRDAHAVIVTTNPLTRDHIEAFSSTVRIIGRAGIGLDAIDLDAARRRRLAVLHLPDYATEEVATHVTSLLLALHRRLFAADRTARTNWMNWREIGPITPIDELVVGVIGCGRIGKAVIRRLAPMAGSILAFDPYVDRVAPPARRAGGLDELLEASDIVTLHVPSVGSGKPLIGRREISLMKRSALLVNAARGSLVDEEALADALENDLLGGAGLDVLSTEPPPRESPIMKAPRTILSPHFAWYSSASEDRARRQVIEGVLDWLSGKLPTFGSMAVLPDSFESGSC